MKIKEELEHDHCVRKVTEDLYWVGSNDRRLELFENIFPIQKGVPTTLICCWMKRPSFSNTVRQRSRQTVSGKYRGCFERAYSGLPCDQSHGTGSLFSYRRTPSSLSRRKDYRKRKNIPDDRTIFSFDLTGKTLTVKEGDTFCSGKHTFRFIMSPMVHWPEAMMTYDEKDKVLFSADAFGTFNALNGIYSTMNLILTESGLMKRAVIIQISSENTARKFKMY